jgi:uncharacterized protein YgiB involved in biofilm formation
VSLVLMGSAAMGLSGCKPKAEAYPNAEACIAAGRETPELCRDAFKRAELEHEKQAPHFRSRDECIAAYGPNGCEEHREGGGSFFMPMMLGYMLGRGLAYHPLYQDPSRRDGMVGPGGTHFNNYTGGFSGGGGSGGGGSFRGGGSGGAPSSSESGTVSRGGFGSAGHGFSGGE